MIIYTLYKLIETIYIYIYIYVSLLDFKSFFDNNININIYIQYPYVSRLILIITSQKRAFHQLVHGRKGRNGYSCQVNEEVR